MATLKPRIAVTLEPHRYDMLKRLAALQGASMSSLISELLESVAEPLERVCVVLEAAKKAPHDVREGLRVATLKAEAAYTPLIAESLDQIDMFLSDASGVVSGLRPRDDGRRPGTAPDPRLVTRGSTTPNPPTPRAVKKSRKPSSSKASIEKGVR